MAKSIKRIALGALIAGAAGYVAGILTAPKDGEATRKDIKHAGDSSIAEAEKQLKNLHTELNKLLTEAKKQGGAAKGEASSKYEDVTSKASVAKQKAREIISAVREGEADNKELHQAMTEASKAIKHLKAYLKK